ncbi:MAG: phage major tail tube protein [Pseudomonadota bacterium]
MREIIRFFSAWAEGESYHLDIEEAQVPGLEDATEDYRGGGMLADFDVVHGLVKLEASMIMTSFAKSLLKKAGLAAGKINTVTMRGSMSSEFEEGSKSVVATVRGRINAKPKPWSAGSKSGVEYPITSISYYKLVVDGELVHEIDMVNLIQIVDGEDQMKEHRANIGLAT